MKGLQRSSLMPQRAAAKAAAAAPAAAAAGPSLSAVSTASTHHGQSTQSGSMNLQPTQSASLGLQPSQGGLQSQASLGSQAGSQSSPMEIMPAASSEAPKRAGNPAANMPALQAGRLGLGLGLKPAATTGTSKCLRLF